MHMADSLLSPVVGGTFWVVSGSLIGYSAKKISQETDGAKTPLMGVLGAFVFAAQMINFTIPGTGSSGHLGGGLLLAVLLGPYRAFITLASVLVIQCLFFADGGVLALGCNIFNLAFFPAFVAYPYIYRVIAGNQSSPGKLAAGSMAAASAGLLIGAFSVVMQTAMSGITDLPVSTFLMFMMPIHLAIGIVEGLVTWAVLSFISKTEPGLLTGHPESGRPRFILASFVISSLIVGGIVSWFASSHPDGLEWSMSKVSGKESIETAGEKVHDILASIQERTAFLPDYGFKTVDHAAGSSADTSSPVNPGTSVSGIVGSLCVLICAGGAGFLLRKRVPDLQTDRCNQGEG
jgi:cobalt/nickel transport system permease protein